MPNRGEPPAEVIIHAGGLEKIDAWGATALRTGIELWARRQQQQVSVSQPTDKSAWLMLYHLLASDCPTHLALTNDSSQPSGRCPSAIHLPTVRIRSLADADALSDALLASDAGRLTPALRFLAAQLPELALNALQHGAKSVTDPVACCFYDADEDELQLVVSDLDASYGHGSDAEERLRDAVQTHPDGALTAAVELAASRGLDVTLTLAAGTGRLYWRNGVWSSATAQVIAGFVAALCVPIP